MNYRVYKKTSIKYVSVQTTSAITKCNYVLEI